MMGYNKLILDNEKPTASKKKGPDYTFALLALLIFLVFILLLI